MIVSVTATAPLKATRPIRSRQEVPRTIAGSVGKPVLVEPPALHDRGEVSPLFLEKLEVLHRIAVDDQKIRMGARNELAELARTHKDVRVHDGRGTDDLGGRHDLRADQELAALIVL